MKEAIKRGLLGFPLGIAIGYVISIVVSLFIADGLYSPAALSLVDEMGSEIAAVIFQALLCGVLGASFAAASIIWEIDQWSIAKQTGIYFAVAASSMLPIAYFAHWMERSLMGFIGYFSVFVIVFIVIWLLQYFAWKNIIGTINKKVSPQ